MFVSQAMPATTTTPSEDEAVIAALEHQPGGGTLRSHLTQRTFEANTIQELDQVISTKKYPLDGRNLELSAAFTKSKRKRLAKSVVDDDAGKRHRRRSEVSVSSVPDTGEYSPVPVEGSTTQFRCVSSLWDRLYDFQKVGVKFLLSKYELNTGGLLADEMGLGKSIQVIGLIATLVSTFGSLSAPALIISPTTLISHWEDQFSKWIPNGLVSVARLDDDTVRNVSSSTTPAQVYLVSYEMWRQRFASATRRVAFSLVVLDEAQRIRNPDAKVTLAVKQVDCYCRIGLSGSPIQNNLSELWSIFDFIAPGRLGTLPTFQEELALPIEEGTKPRASLSAIQLSHRCAVLVRNLTAPLMIRRLKSDFSEELGLAPKDEQVLFCQLSREQIEVYCKFLSTQTVTRVLQSDKKMMGKTFYCLSVLRRIANHPDLLLSDPLDVDDYGDASRSGKLAVVIPLLKLWWKQKKRCLLFSQSLGMLDILQQTLGGLGMTFARMDGSTPVAARTAIVAKFDASSKRHGDGDGPFCLLLSTRVGGVGVNLTGAERVVIFDPDWNPMTDAQARERSWRIGQTKNVKIYRLIAADTVEEVICKRQIYKHHLAQKILVDPRQGRVKDWDGLYDMFKAPMANGGVHGGVSKATEKICALLESGRIADPVDDADTAVVRDEADDGEEYRDLITKVWNQDEIETPSLCMSLVDANATDAAASRAVQAVMAEAQRGDRDITVPTWTGKSGGGLGSNQRSQSLLSTLKNGGVTTVKFESEKLVVERAMVKEIVNYFRSQNKYTASTESVLEKFKSKVSSGESEIFRSCLRQLCKFENDAWTLKRQHR